MFYKGTKNMQFGYYENVLQGKNWRHFKIVPRILLDKLKERNRYVELRLRVWYNLTGSIMTFGKVVWLVGMTLLKCVTY
jgi:hypothetical protein